MDPHELEEFAQFLRMAEMSASTGGEGGGMGMPGGARRKSPSPPKWWQAFPAKMALSVGTFTTAMLLFRTYGESLA